MHMNDWDHVSLRALLSDSPSLLSALSNAAAYLYEAESINWAGFYLLRGQELILGPFRGRPACDRIPLQKGVCGKAAREDSVIRVADVLAFPGHIACDAASRSEIVLPLHSGEGEQKRLFGVLDIDSSVPCRFSADDEEQLRACAAIIEQAVNALGPGLI